MDLMGTMIVSLTSGRKIRSMHSANARARQRLTTASRILGDKRRSLFRSGIWQIPVKEQQLCWTTQGVGRLLMVPHTGANGHVPRRIFGARVQRIAIFRSENALAQIDPMPKGSMTWSA